MNYINNNFKGFNNIGNTCYLNSGLQLILNNKELCNNIIKYSYFINDKNIHDENNIFMLQLTEFIKTYYNNSLINRITPDFIKNFISIKNNQFSGFRQNDSFEFIIYLLDYILENINSDKYKQYINENNLDKINDLYQINSTTRIKCKLLSCLNISLHNEKNNFLLLDILNDFNDLDDCYRNYKQREMLYDENSYFCEKCNNKTIASKRIQINIWPNHLIIVLKRFTYNNKINKEINIPLLWRHGYKLKGIIFHSGSLFSGHYIYIGNHNKKWMMFNDDHVSDLNESLLDNYKNFGYIYYFEK